MAENNEDHSHKFLFPLPRELTRDSSWIPEYTKLHVSQINDGSTVLPNEYLNHSAWQTEKYIMYKFGTSER